MVLENKVAVIYGAGGSIGSGVARTFAREGATVFLVGRTRAKLDAVAQEITAAGGSAEVAVVDAVGLYHRPSSGPPHGRAWLRGDTHDNQRLRRGLDAAGGVGDGRHRTSRR